MNVQRTTPVTCVIPDDEQLLEAVRLGADMWAESPVYRHMKQDVAKLIEFAYTMRADDNSFFMVALHHGEVIGFMLGSLAAHGFHTDLFAYDRFVYVSPTRRGSTAASTLITAFEQWAKDNGAARVLLGVTTGTHTDATEKLYNKLGYVTVGVLTMKEI